jgi:hemoglobin-like flavoprotein
MTPHQKELIRQSWAKVSPIADKAADLFYDKLFELEPGVRPLFKNDMGKQKQALMGSLNTVVNSLDHLEKIIPVIQDMGKRHVAYGVKDEHYDTVGSALLWTLEQGLGDDFSAEVKEAWTVAYTTVASVMKQAAGEVEAAPAAAVSSPSAAGRLKSFWGNLLGGASKKPA